MKRLYFLCFLCSYAVAMDNLKVAFEWKQLDFEFPSELARQQAIRDKEFIPENNLPLGLEVYQDRLFVTVPRWKSGVPASLTYINLTDTRKDPPLKPYPSWEAHKLNLNDTPEIVSPFRVRADQCGRLWVLDTGISDLLGDTKIFAPPRLIIYDLHNDALFRSYVIPAEQLKKESFLASIAVEDHNCEDTRVYLADLGKPALIVYSLKKDSSWRVVHHFFNIDPVAGEFNVAGIPFEWTDGVFGLGLSAPNERGFSTLYFHPLTSTYEFSVNTEILQDPASIKQHYHNFTILGSRGNRGQSSVSFLHQKSNVLFYALVNLNAIACWRTTNPSYTMESQGRVYMSNVTMVFPNDIKVDAKDNLWVLSDKLPIFMYSKLNPNEVNFRILTAPVQDAIRGTACDSKLIVSPNIMDRLKPVIYSEGEMRKNQSLNKNSGSSIASGLVLLVVMLVVQRTFN